MVNNDQHVMQLERNYKSGAEEWYCPVCERRFIVQWPPKYKKIILDPVTNTLYTVAAKVAL